MGRQESVERGQARSIIEAAVAASPGMSKSALCEATGVAWGTVWYHVRALEKAGHLKLVRRGGEVHVFPNGIHERRMRWLAALRKDNARRVLALLASRRQLTIADTTREIGCSTGSVRGLLNEFVAVGLAQEHGTGRPRFLACQEAITLAGESVPALTPPVQT